MNKTALKTYLASCVAVLMLGFILFTCWQELQSRNATDLQLKVKAFEAQLSAAVNSEVESLLPLRYYFLNKSFVDRREFNLFSTPILLGNPAIVSLAWAPRVKNTERLDYINTVRADGLKDFSFKRWTSSLGWRAQEQAWARLYFPIFFSEPMQTADKRLGNDLASRPDLASSIEKAIESGNLTVRVSSEQTQGSNLVTVLIPVRLALSENTNNQRQQGLLVAELDLEKIFSDGLALFAEDLLAVEVYQSDREDEPVFSLGEKMQQRSQFEFNYDFFNQPLQIKVATTKKILDSSGNQTFWYLLIPGLLLLTLIIWFNFYSYGLARRSQIDIASAGDDLEQKNRMLQRSVDRHLAIIGMVMDAVVTIDETGIIEEFSASAESIFGYSADEVIGQNVKILMPEPIGRAHDDYLKNYVKTGIVHIIGTSRDVIGMRKNGNTFPLNLKITEQKFEDRSIFIGILHDQSVEKKLAIGQEAALRQLDVVNEQLEKANNDLEQFAYVASHDLKAPLRAIDSLAGWISEDLGDQLQGESLENMGLLRNRVNRLDNLLTDLLEYSRAGRLEGKKQQLNSYQIASDLVDLQGVPEHMTVIVEETLPTVYTNRAGFELILRNLLGNAVKHQRNEDCLIEISAEIYEDRYVFSVSDNGAGIAVENHQKIFEVFTALQSRDVVEGSGMGLAICRRAATFIGGEIWIDPEYSQGARFCFSIPRVNLDQQQ